MNFTHSIKKKGVNEELIRYGLFLYEYSVSLRGLARPKSQLALFL